MSRKIGISFRAVAETAAGLGVTTSGHTVIADRPPGMAGGTGMGMNGGQLLASAIGGCFWNDLHYAAEAEQIALRVDGVDAEIELAGDPARVVHGHVAARLSGNDPAALRRVFDLACRNSTIANSLMPAFGITFDCHTGDSK